MQKTARLDCWRPLVDEIPLRRWLGGKIGWRVLHWTRLRNDLYCVEWDVKLYYTCLHRTRVPELESAEFHHYEVIWNPQKFKKRLCPEQTRSIVHSYRTSVDADWTSCEMYSTEVRSPQLCVSRYSQWRNDHHFQQLRNGPLRSSSCCGQISYYKRQTIQIAGSRPIHVQRLYETFFETENCVWMTNFVVIYIPIGLRVVFFKYTLPWLRQKFTSVPPSKNSLNEANSLNETKLRGGMRRIPPLSPNSPLYSEEEEDFA